MTPRGAACQKWGHALTYHPDTSSGFVKVGCPVCLAHTNSTKAEIRKGCHPCRCGAGHLIPMKLEACRDLAPQHLDEHPDYIAKLAAANVKGKVLKSYAGDHLCGACGDLISHPRAHCHCGFDNGAGAYVEGSSRLSEGGRRYVQSQPRRRWAEGERVVPIESVDLPF